MPETVVKTAKTIELAIQAALDELGVPESRVECEVLDHPSRGFLGILGGRPARVRVTLKEDGSTAPDPGIGAMKEEEREGTSLPADQEACQAKPLDPPKGEPAGEKAPAPESRKEIPAEEKQRALQVAKSFLEDVFQAMDVQAEMQERETDAGYCIGLSGKRLGIIIGKHGQTLDALQYLTNLAANRDSYEHRVRISIDVEGYRNRREETLQKLAKRMADRAVRTRQDIKLEPMNRHERKIIHMALQDNHRVTTYSDGEEPYRSLVISPVRRKGRK